MSESDAEAYLLGLELFGMRFGLDRMRRLLTVLGAPQAGFRPIHVVGSNGKSSTTRLAAAILRRHGLHTGAYLSPHFVSFAERVRIDDADLDGAAFAAAVARVRAAAVKVEHTLPDDERVTQFEAVTAAGFDALGRAGVAVAVIEAGLGGRYDATNVLGAPVVVLTNVSLEHTRWLGPTITDIAREKLAVVPAGGTLVIGEDLHPDARVVADETIERTGGRLVVAPRRADVRLRARGTFQERNFALAATAVRELLGAELDASAVGAAAASTLVPGRFEVREPADPSREPTTVLDGAHNPEGTAALAASLPAFLDGRRLVAVVSVLDDKDAAAMLGQLLAHADELVVTSCSNPRALSPATLASLAGQLGRPDPPVRADPREALALGASLAGPGGVVLATGSLYLLADLLRPAGRRASTL